MTMSTAMSPTTWTVMKATTYATALAVVVLVVFWRLRRNRKATRLHILDWKPDVVYLVQFPPSPHVRSISPFSIKLETWLRLTKITYENVYSMKFGGKGQIPYIELNGCQIADSNIIISKLKEHFKVDPDEGLDPRDAAVAHATTVMVENHTAIAGFNWRYGYHINEFCDKLMGNFLKSGSSMFFFRNIQPYGIRLRAHLQGLGRHSNDEIAEFTFHDIKAISSVLDDRDFLLGTEDPTTVDCTLFGHLVQFLYIPMAIPQKKYLKDNCPNIVNYIDRVRNRLWPDWKEMCDGSCMVGSLGYDLKGR